MLILENIILITLSFLAIPVFVFSIQIIAATLSKKFLRLNIKRLNSRPSVAIVIPAHNEELGIESTLNSICNQLELNDQFIVVADNCDDNTAVIARKFGATTLERRNSNLRGKGFALDYAINHLKKTPPEVVIIIDADCIASPNLVSVLAAECISSQRPIQANDIMRFKDKAGLKQSVLEFAWLVKNTVRPLGYRALGFPCQLMGTGMAILWKDLASCNLASGNLVEDMQLGLDLAKIGKPPLFNTDAFVMSYFPSSSDGQDLQHSRWEHGHLSLIINQTPRLLKHALIKRNNMLFALIMDILVPPIALLFTFTTAFFLLSVLFLFKHNLIIPFVFSSIIFANLGLIILLAWYVFGRQTISFNQLLMAPLILLMKLPIYVGFLFRRQVDWVRSKRD